MIFVCPTPPELRGKMDAFPRLYARPAIPEPIGETEIIIADSGAYGLSQRGKRLTPSMFAGLEEHYLRVAATHYRPVVGVAPDVFLDPVRTIANWERWVADRRRPVAPVIQSPVKGFVSPGLLMDQADYYVHFQPPVVFVSNPGLGGAEADSQGIGRVFEALRSKIPNVWIHVLGAGWEPRDAKDWREIRPTPPDSIDSISYYIDAKRNRPWLGEPASDSRHWSEVAVANALAISLVSAGDDSPLAQAPSSRFARNSSYGLG